MRAAAVSDSDLLVTEGRSLAEERKAEGAENASEEATPVIIMTVTRPRDITLRARAGKASGIREGAKWRTLYVRFPPLPPRPTPSRP
eukprot:1790225-Rhodomonas_salina.2